MNENNPYPEVNVYKYAVTIVMGYLVKKSYIEGRIKYLLIKKVKRALKKYL